MQRSICSVRQLEFFNYELGSLRSEVILKVGFRIDCWPLTCAENCRRGSKVMAPIFEPSQSHSICKQRQRHLIDDFNPLFCSKFISNVALSPAQEKGKGEQTVSLRVLFLSPQALKQNFLVGKLSCELDVKLPIPKKTTRQQKHVMLFTSSITMSLMEKVKCSLTFVPSYFC